MADQNAQLVVLGAGPGGYAAAFLAADLGISVTLIDPAPNPGGVCLYRGCIPSKTLLHIAALINETRETHRWGVTFDEPRIDLDRVRARKSSVVDQLTSGLGQLVGKKGIDYIQGTAAFRDNRSLTVTSADGKESTLVFEHAIVTTGSTAVTIPQLDKDIAGVWNATRALELERIPERLLVVGGGYIGLEMGSVYAALGAAVSVVEMTPTLLPGVDRDLVRFLQKGLDARFNAIWLQTKVMAAASQGKTVKVTFEGPDQKSFDKFFDAVLVAVGRRPRTNGLGLENTGVEVDDHGFIRVDAQRRTAVPAIFAAGDVAGQPMLAHKASHEARVAVEVIAGRKVAYEPAAIPAVVFTDPEIAWAGLTEAEAKGKGLDYEIARFPWAASGRAASLDRTDGLTKMVVDPRNERILGIGLVGPGAGELIAEAVLAIEMAATVTDMGLTIHPHPTLSETLMEAAHVFHGTSAHYHRPKRKKK